MRNKIGISSYNYGKQPMNTTFIQKKGTLGVLVYLLPLFCLLGNIQTYVRGCGAYSGGVGYTCMMCHAVYGTTLINGRCWCLDGKYWIAGANKCEDCDPTCPTCVENPTKCTTCPAGKYESRQLNGSGVRDCLDRCPAGETTAPDSNRCATCVSPCSECLQSPGQCLRCLDSPSNPTKYLKTHTFTCLIECGLGAYIYNSVNDCANCNYRCNVCTSSSVCTTCKPKYMLRNNECPLCPVGEWEHEDACHPSCPVRTYGYSGNELNLCYNCQSGCLDCLTSQHCTKCDISGSKPTLFNKKCYGTCPTGTLEVVLPNGDKECQGCDTSCDTCTGVGANECSTCKPSFYLGGNNNCSACSPNCQTCSSSGIDQCTQCKSGKLKNITGSDLLLFECVDSCSAITKVKHLTECLNECPLTFFDSSGNCLPCSTDCSSCVDNAAKCFSCPDPTHFLDEANTCVTTCDLTSGKLITTEASIKKCSSCEVSCKECLGTVTSCTKCISPLYYSQDSCNGECPEKQYSYKNAINEGLCGNCHSSCLECHGTGKDECLSCSMETFKNWISQALGTFECLDTCPEGKFTTTSTSFIKICEECDPSCKTCKTEFKLCTGCSPPFTLNQELQTCSSPIALEFMIQQIPAPTAKGDYTLKISFNQPNTYKFMLIQENTPQLFKILSGETELSSTSYYSSELGILTDVFSPTPSDSIKIEVIPLMLINASPNVVLASQIIELELFKEEKIEEKVMEEVKEQGKTMDTVGEATTAVTSGVASIASALPIDPTGVALKSAQLMNLLKKFRFINIYKGELLESQMRGSAEELSHGRLLFETKSSQYLEETQNGYKGAFNKYNLTLSFTGLPLIKAIIFAISWLMKIFGEFLLARMEDKREISVCSIKYLKHQKKVHFLIFSISSPDVIFYSARVLLHRKYTFVSLRWIIISFILLSFATLDFLEIIRAVYLFVGAPSSKPDQIKQDDSKEVSKIKPKKPITGEQEQKKLVPLSESMVGLNKDDGEKDQTGKLNQAQEGKIVNSVITQRLNPNQIHPQAETKEKKRQLIKKTSLKGRKKLKGRIRIGGITSKGNRKLKNTINPFNLPWLRKKHLQKLKKLEERKIGPKLIMTKMKVIDFDRTIYQAKQNLPIYSFLIGELKADNLIQKRKICLFSTTVFVLRIAAFNILIVALPFAPQVQMIGLVSMESGYLILILMAFIKHKHFKSWLLFVSKICQSIFMLSFFLILLIIALKNGAKKKPVSLMIQKIGIFLRSGGLYSEIFFAILKLLQSLYFLIKNRKKKSKKKEDIFYKFKMIEAPPLASQLLEFKEKKQQIKENNVKTKVDLIKPQKRLVLEFKGIDEAPKNKVDQHKLDQEKCQDQLQDVQNIPKEKENKKNDKFRTGILKEGINSNE